MELYRNNSDSLKTETARHCRAALSGGVNLERPLMPRRHRFGFGENRDEAVLLGVGQIVGQREVILLHRHVAVEGDFRNVLLHRSDDGGHSFVKLGEFQIRNIRTSHMHLLELARLDCVADFVLDHVRSVLGRRLKKLFKDSIS